MLIKIINTVGTKVLSLIFNFSTAIIISQYLGDVGKGKQSLLLMTIAFILIISNIVSGKTIVYLTPKYSFSKLILPSYLWSILVGVIAIIGLSIFNASLDASIIVHVGMLSVFASLNAINVSILIGKEKIKTANYINLLQPILVAITLFISYVILNEKTIYPYILSLYISYGGCWIIGIIALWKEYAKTHFYGLKEYNPVVNSLFKYGFLNQCGHFVQFINLRLSFYLLEIYTDIGKVGVFSNAVSLSETIWVISNSIALVQYAKISNTNDGKYAQSLTLRLIKICFVLSFFLILALICLPASFFTFVFGAEFQEVSPILRLLAPGVLCYSVFLIVGHFFSGIGKYQINLYASITGLIFTVLLGFILVPKISIYGAAITSSASYIATAIFISIIFLRHSHFKISDLLLTKKEIKNTYNDFRAYLHQTFKK